MDNTNQKTFSPTFLVLAMMFCVCLLLSNIVEIKVVDFGFITITAGVLIFPISYIINDCIVEIYGFDKARFVIWLGFAMNLFVSLVFQLVIWLPGSDEWAGQEAMTLIFGAVPRIFVASFTAFLCGLMVNAYVMSVMKSKSPNRGFSIRAIVSTLFGEGIDSLIFFPIAFWGVLSVGLIVELIITQIVIKTLYEILILPVTISVVKRLLKIEGDSAGDEQIVLD